MEDGALWMGGAGAFIGAAVAIIIALSAKNDQKKKGNDKKSKK